MLILTGVNVSNPMNLHADSGYIFTRALIEGVLTCRPTWRFIVMCPPTAMFEHPQVQVLPQTPVATKYQARFHFDWESIGRTLNQRAEPIDLVWINQAEQAGSLLALVRATEQRSIPALTYFHYPVPLSVDEERGVRFDPSLNDWGLGKLILMRQLEALACSEISVVGSKFARDLIVGAVHFVLPNAATPALAVLPPPLDYAPLTAVDKVTDLRSVIMYNHRLYKHYGTEEFIRRVEDFAGWFSKPFSVLVLNPSANRTRVQDLLDPSIQVAKSRLESLPFVRLITPESRSEYLALVRSCRVGLAPFRESPPWSMSAVDVLAAGKPLLAPWGGPFPEMLHDRTALLFRDEIEFREKLAQLLVSDEHWSTEAGYCLSRSNDYRQDIIAERFACLIEATINSNGHQNGSHHL